MSPCKAVSVLALAVLLTFSGAARTSAASVYYFTDDSVIGGIGVDAIAPGYGSVTLQQLAAGKVNVTVSLAVNEHFIDTHDHVAFAFNLLGAPWLTYANVSDVTPGFLFLSPGGTHVENSPFGEFNYGFACLACLGGLGPSGPLSFTLTLNGLSEGSFRATSTGGYYFAADIDRWARPGLGNWGAIGVPGSQVPPNQITAIPTPEPASLLLFGTGLTVIARRFRKKR